MRLSFVAAVLAMLAFNTVMAAPISIKDQSEVVRDMEDYHVVTTSTALEPANQKSHETQNHEDYPQLVRRDLTAEEHRSEADAHDQKSAEYRQRWSRYSNRASGEPLLSNEREKYVKIARINSHMANHHEFEAQRNRNMAQAVETQDQDPVLSGKLRQDAELNGEMASEELKSAKGWKERLRVQKARQERKSRVAAQRKQEQEQERQ
ncbi:hypothetical protein FRC20_003286, partial [Serendipita sp. 405]